jgi:adenylate cyclase
MGHGFDCRFTAGWVLVQVSSVVLPAFDAPEWILRVFIILVALGFPLAVVLAWAFEITPDGVRRTQPEHGDALPLKSYIFKFTVVGILVVVIVFSLYRAGLPEVIFADGIAEDILTGLQAWRSFPVISRNSAFVYKVKAVDVRTIAEKLGVGYVLEGSVRKSGDKVRITAQLIDARTDTHLWAERYDRQLVDVLEVQDQITLNIVSAIAPEMARSEMPRVKAVRTQDMQA